MALDIPHIDYSDKKKNTPKKLDPNDASLKLQEEANKKARERRKAKEWKKIQLSDENTPLNTHE